MTPTFDINNCVVKNLSPEMGKKIIGLFGSADFNTQGYQGDMYAGLDCDRFFYGTIAGVFDNYTLKEVEAASATIITLKQLKSYRKTPEDGTFILYPEPKVMEVWDRPEKRNCSEKRTVFGELTIFGKTSFITKVLDQIDIPIGYAYASPIPEKVRLSKQDISEGKGKGVPVELMEIID